MTVLPLGIGEAFFAQCPGFLLLRIALPSFPPLRFFVWVRGVFFFYPKPFFLAILFPDVAIYFALAALCPFFLKFLCRFCCFFPTLDVSFFLPYVPSTLFIPSFLGLHPAIPPLLPRLIEACFGFPKLQNMTSNRSEPHNTESVL